MDNLVEFLNWIIYSGGAMLVASKLLELFPAFAALESKVKWSINLAICMVLAIGAYALLVYLPADVIAVIDPWFKVISGLFMLYTGQQIVHKQTKK